MTCKYMCDGCGKEMLATHYGHGLCFKPDSWFQRSDKDGPQDACSRECIEKIAEKSGKTGVVAPF